MKSETRLRRLIKDAMREVRNNSYKVDEQQDLGIFVESILEELRQEQIDSIPEREPTEWEKESIEEHERLEKANANVYSKAYDIKTEKDVRNMFRDEEYEDIRRDEELLCSLDSCRIRAEQDNDQVAVKCIERLSRRVGKEYEEANERQMAKSKLQERISALRLCAGYQGVLGEIKSGLLLTKQLKELEKEYEDLPFT